MAKKKPVPDIIDAGGFAETPMAGGAAPAKLRRVALADITPHPSDRPRRERSVTWRDAIDPTSTIRPLPPEGLPFDVSDIAGIVVDGACALFQEAPGVYEPFDGRTQYGGVWGERRLWAALLAGCTHVSVKVYDGISADEAAVMHVRENAAHAPLPPLCEARELARLRDEHHLDVPTIAARTGKREADVRRSLLLLSAISEAQAALGAGGITVDVAAFFGRHAEDMQRAAWVAVGARVTPGEAVGLRPWVRGLFARLPLAGVAWSLDDTMRVDGGLIGPCTGCPRRSDAQAALPGLDEGAGAYCLDRPCYERKEAVVEGREAAERKRHLPVVQQAPEASDDGAEGDDEDAPASEPLPRAEPQSSAADERKAAARAAEEEDRAVVRAVVQKAAGGEDPRVALGWLSRILPEAAEFVRDVEGVASFEGVPSDYAEGLVFGVLAAELLTRAPDVAALPARWAGLGKPEAKAAKKAGAVKKGEPPCTCPPGPGRHGATCPVGDTKRRDAQTRAEITQPKREPDAASTLHRNILAAAKTARTEKQIAAACKPAKAAEVSTAIQELLDARKLDRAGNVYAAREPS